MNAGAEASFKVSRTWERAQNKTFGLDGLRHIIQPFANFSYVTGNGTDPAEILQFDRYIPSTRLRPIDFPQFTSIDSIENWTIARIGIRQPPADAPRRQHHQLDGVRELFRREHR
jgi:hypothetical protein